MYWIHAQLKQGKPLTMEKIVREFERSERTINRDIRYMKKEWKAPIDFKRKENYYYYTHTTFDLPAIPMTRGELLAIFFAERVLSQSAALPYEGELRSALQKVVAEQPEVLTVQFDRLMAGLSLTEGQVRPLDVENFNRVNEAIEEHRRLRIRYFSQKRGEETERVIDPLHLYLHRDEWFLIAWCHLRGDYREFAINGERLRYLEPTGETFERPSDFHAAEYLRRSFGVEKGGEPLDVAIRFDTHESRYVRERTWHPTQRVEELPDGGLILRFQATGRTEILRWVLQHGAHAEILSPPALRAAAREEVRRMGEQYG
jgi:predicted DNA-binding transcriptional regulator YafY